MNTSSLTAASSSSSSVVDFSGFPTYRQDINCIYCCNRLALSSHLMGGLLYRCFLSHRLWPSGRTAVVTTTFWPILWVITEPVPPEREWDLLSAAAMWWGPSLSHEHTCMHNKWIIGFCMKKHRLVYILFLLPSAVYIKLVMFVARASSITTRQPDLHDIFNSMNIFIFWYKLMSRAINKQHLIFLTIFGGQPSLPFSMGRGGIHSFILDIIMRGFLKWRLAPACTHRSPAAVSPTLEDVIMQQSDTCPCAPWHNAALKKQQFDHKKK